MPRLSTLIKTLKNLPQNIFDPPVIVLLYHRVIDRDNDPEQLAVSPVNFAAQLAFLKEHFSVFRFEEGWSSPRRPAVVITFDDGYVDNLREALPLLRHYELPATFFVSSGTVDDSRGFWWDRLGRMLLRPGHFYPDKWGAVNTASPEAREKLYRELQKELKKATPVHREKIFTSLASWSDLSDVVDDADRPMTAAELCELVSCPLVTLGSHTVTHRQLSALPAAEQQQEIAEGHRRLEALAGRSLSVFSYPFGNLEDYNDDSIEACRQLGFARVAANYPAVAHRRTSPFAVPRIIVRNSSLAVFKRQLSIARWLR